MSSAAACICVVALAGAATAIVYVKRRRDSNQEDDGGAGILTSSYKAGESDIVGGLPLDIVDRLEQFGRFSLDPMRCVVPSERIWGDIVAPLFPLSQVDPVKFVADLKDRVLNVGGWPVFGAARMVIELLGGRLADPAYHQLQSAALQFLRDRGVPNLRLAGYEWEFWRDNAGKNEPWLVGKPKPTAGEGPIADLAPGELRCIARLTDDSASNLILVCSTENVGYAAVVDAPYSDDDPTRSQSVWKNAATLSDLYWEIGCAFQVPTYWYHAELEPYFPLPPPRLD